MASMAGVRGVAILALLVVVVWIAEGPTMAVALRAPNGLPRPTGYELTSSYGPTPPCLLNGAAVTCDWYGFSYTAYEADALVSECLNVTRTFLANTTLNPPGSLLPYEYYYLTYFVFSTATNNSYCLYGCFDMSYTGPAPAPVAPSQAPLSPPAPTPVAKAPAPSTLFSPPPSVSPPPPSVLASPPPPSLLVSPPPPVTKSTPPPPSGTSGTSPPPPPRVFNLNDAGFLRVPTGLMWFAVSGALLILSGLVAF